MHFFLRHTFRMDIKAALADIERRAFEARVPIYKLCQQADVAPSTVSRWKAGVKPGVTTIGKLERRLDAIEKEQKA